MEKLTEITGPLPAWAVPGCSGKALGWPHESWAEYADACFDHDDRPAVPSGHDDRPAVPSGQGGQEGP